jgi:DNA primase
MSELIPQQRIDDIRARFRVSDVARHLTKLRKVGAEYGGLCPFHKEKTASFTVNDAKGFYHCFGCGSHGDIIRLAQEGFGLSFRDAVNMIDGAGLPPVDPKQWAKEKEQDGRLDAEAVADALRFWEGGDDIAGTPADAYLMLRGIRVRPDNLRFNRIPTWKDPETGRWNRPRPALMLRAENLAAEFVGIQRIYLTEDGRKADMAKPKLSLGSVRGASMRFGKPAVDVMLIGGPENGLSLFQDFNEMVTVYVSPGEAMMYAVRLPTLTKAVTIVRQNDGPGIAAARRAKQEIASTGRLTRALGPPRQFKDWNDKICGMNAIAAATRRVKTAKRAECVASQSGPA